MADAATATEEVIGLQAVTKVYGDDENPVPVLHGVDLIVRKGEFVAIVGPSGSGKSTLLNILGCLDRPTTGAFRLRGEDIARFDDTRLSRVRNRRIGFVFQSFQLVTHLGVLENVELPLLYARVPRAERHRKAKELIARVGLSHRLDHRPAQLSGGERQRCAIARALVSDPDLLLADEPTGNLDTATSKEIMALFRELHAAGSTIILITHDPEVAAQAKRRVSIRDGRIFADSGAGA